MKFKTTTLIVILTIFLLLIVTGFLYTQNLESKDNLTNNSKNESEVLIGIIKSVEIIDVQYKIFIINNNGEYVVNIPKDVEIDFPEMYDRSNISVGGVIEIKYSGIMTRSLPPILTASSVLYYPPEFVTTGVVTEIGEQNGFKRFLVEGENSLCYVTVTNDTIVSGDLTDISINSTVTYTSVIQLLSYPGQCGAIHFIINN